MKNEMKLITLIILSTLYASADTNVIANTTQKNYFFSLGLGNAMMNIDTDLRSNVILNDKALDDSALAIDFNLGYYYTPDIFLTLGYQNLSLDLAKINHFYSSINYQLSDNTFNPYVGIVTGYANLSWDKEPAISRYNKDLTETTSTVGVQVGSQIKLNQNLALFAKYQVLFGDLTMELYNNTSSIKHTQFNNLTIGVHYDF